MRMMLIQYPQFKGDDLRFALFFDRGFYLVFSENKKLFNDFMKEIDLMPDGVYYTQLQYDNADYEPLLKERYFNEDDIHSGKNDEIIDLLLKHEKIFHIPTPDDDMFAYCEIGFSYPKDDVDYFNELKVKLNVAFDKYKDDIIKEYRKSYVRNAKGEVLNFKIKE